MRFTINYTQLDASVFYGSCICLS